VDRIQYKISNIGLILLMGNYFLDRRFDVKESDNGSVD